MRDLLGKVQVPVVLILNKIDAVDFPQEALLKREFPGAIPMSALNPKHIEALHERAFPAAGTPVVRVYPNPARTGAGRWV